MSNQDFQAGLMIGLLMNETRNHQEVIEMQKQIIQLQQKIQEMTPPQPEMEEVSFHMQKGMMEDEAANSDSIAVLEDYIQWVLDFTRKYVRPYVNQRVYQEVSGHMMRGLSDRITELEYRQKYGKDVVRFKPEREKQAATSAH
jgi:hypothetical protein